MSETVVVVEEAKVRAARSKETLKYPIGTIVQIKPFRTKAPRRGDVDLVGKRGAVVGHAEVDGHGRLLVDFGNGLRVLFGVRQVTAIPE